MTDCRAFFCFITVFLVIGLLSSSAFSENYVINGSLQTKGKKRHIVNTNVRSESLLIKGNKVYIRVFLDVGARHIGDTSRTKEWLYLLPKDVVYDEVSKRIFYYKNNSEIEIAREKSFLGFMPYMALADGVKVMSSPTDAKLLVSLGKSDRSVPVPGLSPEDGMEESLNKKCGQCHVLEYIYSHEEWIEEDVLHAFNRMQMEKQKFTKKQQEIIDLFKEYQKGEIDEGHLAEFKLLKEIAEKDVVDFTKGVYKSNCVPCHNQSEISDVSAQYTSRRCKSVIERMKEKKPSLFLNADTDRLASQLWEIKLTPGGGS
ncbi:MAG: hypothetical protein NOU37_07525 [Candidatus Brocadiales bacterium]|nr:hypothetical protein [Candidatus Bathyanammoxibius amoris]